MEWIDLERRKTNKPLWDWEMEKELEVIVEEQGLVVREVTVNSAKINQQHNEE